MDPDSSTCDTASVVGGDDVNESVSSSVLSPLGDVDDHLANSLLRDGSFSSDVEDADEQKKEG